MNMFEIHFQTYDVRCEGYVTLTGVGWFGGERTSEKKQCANAFVQG